MTRFDRDVGAAAVLDLLGEAPATIDAVTLSYWRAKGMRVALLDVDPVAERNHLSRIPGAVWLSGPELALHAIDMAAESEVIVLYASVRMHAEFAARVLLDLGLANVAVLDGGRSAWAQAGYSLENRAPARRFAPTFASRQFAELATARLAKLAGAEELEAADVAARKDESATALHVIDLRDEADFRAAHIAGSNCLPGEQAVVKIATVVRAHDALLVLVDESPVRARLTASWLVRSGYVKVGVLAGGLPAWVAAGLPMADPGA